MKSTILSLVTISLVLAAAFERASAQPAPTPPGQISYQGFLTDANGLPLATNTPRNFNLIFRIWDASTGGTNQWAEQQVVTVDRGYFTVLLGNGTAVSGAPFTNNLGSVFSGTTASDRYLEITVLGLAPGDPPIAPRLRLLASPYAFLAQSSLKLINSATGGDLVTSSGGTVTVNGPVAATSFTGNGSGLTGFTAGQIPNLDGSKITGNLDVTKLSGNIPDARLSTNVALRAGGNAFSGNQVITGGTLGVGNSNPGANTVAINQLYEPANGYGLVVCDPGGNGYGQSIQINRGAGQSGIGLVVDNFSTGDSSTSMLLARNGTGNGGQSLFDVRGNGRVGIGTSSPAVQLDVVGGVSLYMSDLFHQGINEYSSTSAGGDFGYNVAITRTIGIRTDQAMAAAYGLFAYSDRRIKKDIKSSETAADLASIQRLRVADFRMVDPSQTGATWRKGFIAQEAETVMPEAVSRSTEFIPDVFLLATNVSFDAQTHRLTLSLPKEHGLKTEDRVRLHTDGRRQDLEVTAVPSPLSFTVAKCDAKPGQVFVYGKQVNDFRVVDYDRIFTTGVGAIQELARRVENLEQREAHLAELERKAGRVASLEQDVAELKRLVAQLAVAGKPDTHTALTVPPPAAGDPVPPAFATVGLAR